MLSSIRTFFAPRPLDAAGIAGYQKLLAKIATKAYVNGRNGRIDNFGIGPQRAGGFTDIATTVREGNEDGLLLALRKFTGHEQLLITVADGIGGHGGGEIASALTLNAIAKYFCQCVPDAFSHTAAVTQAVVELAAWKAGHPEVDETAGTTLVSALVNLRTGILSLAHIGDARAYLLRGNDLFLLTKDDNYMDTYIKAFAGWNVSPAFNSLVSLLGTDPAEAYRRLPAPFSARFSQLIHDASLNYLNLEAVGGKISKAIGVDEGNGFRPTRWNFPLAKDDVLVLMSDGVHDFIAYDPLKQVLLKNRYRTPLQIAEAIFAELHDNKDNATLGIYRPVF